MEKGILLMKRDTAIQLMSLLKAKTQLERFSYEDIRQQNLTALQKASSLRKQATAKPEHQPADSKATLYQHNENHISRLLSSSRIEKQRADSMIDTMIERRNKVQAALQRELALKEMAARLEEEHRKKRNKQEEGQHEHLRAIKPAKPPS
jgi:hypothetical protein